MSISGDATLPIAAIRQKAEIYQQITGYWPSPATGWPSTSRRGQVVVRIGTEVAEHYQRFAALILDFDSCRCS